MEIYFRYLCWRSRFLVVFLHACGQLKIAYGHMPVLMSDVAYGEEMQEGYTRWDN